MLLDHPCDHAFIAFHGKLLERFVHAFYPESQYLLEVFLVSDLLLDTVAQGVVNKLRWLAENFDAARPEALVGPLTGLRKLRVGHYRVIYEPDRQNRLITVHLIGHRSEIYHHS
jgi:mRNA interferase RelE/StbE